MFTGLFKIPKPENEKGLSYCYIMDGINYDGLDVIGINFQFYLSRVSKHEETLFDKLYRETF